MMNDYDDSFAVVQYHVHDSYAVPWGDDRGEFYRIWDDGIPWFAMDGLFDAWPINTYESKFLARRNIPTDVTLSVGAENIAGNDYRISVRACIEPDGTTKPMKIYMVVVQDRYPTSPSYARNFFRIATPITSVNVASGECVLVEQSVTLNASWNTRDLRIIAWAQATNSSYPAEVYQACKMSWPFAGGLPEIGDTDNDGDVDLDDYDVFKGCMTGPGGDGATEVCIELFDADGDKGVDLDDVVVFLEAFTGEQN